MNLELELQRMIDAANKVLYQNDEMKAQRYSDSSRQDYKTALYDLRKAKNRAESELKKKQTELFTN